MFEDIEQMDDEMKAKVELEVGKIESYAKAMIKRVENITLIHEDLVVVEKIDVRSMKSILFFVENTRFDRLKNSYYGRVLKISEIDSMDDVKEAKKKRLKIGDIVTFNPDVGYSLNIIVPEEMPEIWVISVDNVLTVDRGFDPAQAKRKTIIANLIIGRQNDKIQREALRKEEAALRKKAAEEGRIV